MRVARRLPVLVAHYQLLVELFRKEFDVRYAGSILGVLWTQLYPLLLLVVYSFVFSTIFHSDIPNFPLFLFTGIAVYQFFATAIQMASGSILANAQLVGRLGFPRELVTLAVVLIPLVDLAMSQVILLGGAAWYGVRPAWSWAAMPLVIFLLALICAGTGLMLATAAVYLRDVRFFVEVVVLMLMFMSPVFYSASSVPASMSWMLSVNPLAVAISAYRAAFLEGTWPALTSWVTLAVFGLAALWIGIEVFDRGQRGFADAL